MSFFSHRRHHGARILPFRLRTGALAALAVLGAPPGHAGPEGGQVTGGSGQIVQAGGLTTVMQNSATLLLNWQSFQIGAGERVQFVQPSAAALAINRIADPQGARILGRLDANGQVWLLSPGGIVFGRDAQVNVGGLVASTLSLKDGAGAGGVYGFGQPGATANTAAVLNEGRITAAPGGYVALLGHAVVNRGQIDVPRGSVALGAGSAVTLRLDGQRLLGLEVDASLLDTLADNGGLLRADGGQVLMSAGARDTLLASVVNHTGVVQAQTVQQTEGRIVLLGGMAAGTTRVAGTLDASAPAGSGAGGFIETSAAHVKVAEGSRITTAAGAGGRAGLWLVDPVDFTVAASGGDISGATLGANLANGNVTLQSTSGASGTAGDVTVNDSVAWSANRLTLNAQNHIRLNAALNGSGTASLALEYGQAAVAAGNTSDYLVNAAVSLPAGANFSTRLGSDGTVKNYTVITSLGTVGSTTAADLQGMSGGLGTNYALGADIDASGTAAWNGGAGFEPVGNSSTPYTGTFAGLGHAIDRLGINRTTSVEVGLFGQASAAVIRDVNLTGGSVAGGTSTADWIGSLVGRATSSSISGATASVAVTGGRPGAGRAGGLVGRLDGAGATLTGSRASGEVTGTGFVTGGLVAEIASPASVSSSSASGAVTGPRNVGGLIGYASGGSIAASSASGAVTGNSASTNYGGLVGYSRTSTSQSYATGAVSGNSNVGGLVGQWDGGAFSDSYATGNAAASGSYAGGLIGRGPSFGSGLTLNRLYATGTATGTSNVGGFAGNLTSSGVTASNSYWNSSGNSVGVGNRTVAGVSGLSSSQLKQSSNFAGFNFSTTWFNYDGNSTPLLRSFLTPLTVSPNGKVYDGLAYGGAVSHSVTPDATLLGTVAYSCSPACAAEAGTYAVTLSGLYSTSNRGYLISYGSAATITRAPLTITATAASKTYDGLAYAGGNGVGYSGFVNGESSSVLGGALAYGGSSQGAVNAGSYTITPSGLSSANYDIAYASGNLTVDKAVLTVTADDATRTYGNANPTLSTRVAGFVNGESASTAAGYAGSGSATTLATALTGAGTAAITASAGSLSADNYVFTQLVDGTLTITRAPLTITATAASKTYDGLAYAGGNGVGYSGFVNGDTPAALSGALNYDGSSQGAVNAGVYGLQPQGLAAANYEISYVGSALTVQRATLAVQTQALDKVYDGTAGAALALGALTGLAGRETLAVSATGRHADAGVGRGKTVAVQYRLADGANGGLAANYVLADTTLQAHITPAPLFYVARPAESRAGLPMAPLDGSVAGLVADETLASATQGTLVWSTTAGPGSAPGAYAVQGGGLTAANYTLMQAPANAQALLLRPGQVPTPVAATLTQLSSNLGGLLGHPPALVSPAPASAAPAPPAGPPVPAEARSAEPNAPARAPSVPTTRLGGASGPRLQIEGHAVRLPGQQTGAEQ